MVADFGHLSKARCLAEEAQRIVWEQKGRIIRLRAAGRDTWGAERILRLLEATAPPQPRPLVRPGGSSYPLARTDRDGPKPLTRQEANSDRLSAGQNRSDNRYPLLWIMRSHRDKKVMAGTSPAITVVALSLRRLVSTSPG